MSTMRSRIRRDGLPRAWGSSANGMRDEMQMPARTRTSGGDRDADGGEARERESSESAVRELKRFAYSKGTFEACELEVPICAQNGVIA